MNPQPRAVLFDPPDCVTVDVVDIPAADEGELFLATSISFPSPGTELRALSGHQVGAPSGAFIPGYAAAGQVMASSHPEWTVGTRVSWAGTTRASHNLLWGGHVSHALVPANRVIRVPDGVSDFSAAFAQIGGISHRGLELSKAQANETVVVIGLGLIGLSSALLHASTGARVIGVDRQTERTRLASQLGLEVAASLDDARSLVPDGADVVVDASGVADLLEPSMLLARQNPFGDAAPGPRLVVQGSYATDVRVPYDTAFRREVSILFPRDRHAGNVRAVLELIRSGQMPAAEQFAEEVQADRAPEIYAAWRSGRAVPIGVGFRW